MSHNSLLEIAAFTPRSLQFPNAWMGHLPFASWVIKDISPNIFVELGTHSGNSYFSFCQAVAESGIATKCYAVDTWEGDEHAGKYDNEVFSKVNAHNEEHYVGFSRLLRMTFDDATAYFSNDSIELLHIDGLHTYDAVRHDFETWLPKLAPGAVVMLHDTNVRERNFGVWKLWEELRVQYPHHLDFVNSQGLGVFQLNNVSDDKKLEWLQPNEEKKQRIVKYFTALGSRQLERFDIIELKQNITSLNNNAAVREGQITELNQAVAVREGQIAELNQIVAVREGQIAELNQIVAVREGQIAELNQTVAVRESQIVELNQTVAVRENQIVELNQTVAGCDGQIGILKYHQQDQQRKNIQIHRAITQNTFMKLGCILDRLSYRKRSEYYRLWRAVRAQPLFDAEWYANQNPDVQISKKKSLYHYYFFGAEEGRNPNPYFDTLWYLNEYPDVARYGINPLLHYLEHGAQEGRNPSSYFDTRWYLTEYPDILSNGINPLLHYLKYGVKEGKNPNPHFDATWYLTEYPELAGRDIDPHLHYLLYGAAEGKKPSPYFDTRWYLTEYNDVARCGMNPLLHYRRHGIIERRNPNPFFDAQWYVSEYPEVASIGMDPFLHYLKFGVEEGKNPNPYFDTRWYLSEYPEVAKMEMNPLLHYMMHGVEGGNNPSPHFDIRWYLTEYPEVANIGMDPLHHFLKYGVHEGRKTAFKAIIPGYELARNGQPSSEHFILHSVATSSESINFDLILVTYNSAKWVDNCLSSLLPHDKNITITIVDNCSEDDTVARLEMYQRRFSSFKIIKSKSNLGFGAANNLGAQSNTNNHLIFLNIDTELQKADFFSALSRIIIASKKDVVAWEFRQLPYEHPKCYDPVSLETSWFSGAAVAVRRDAFEEVGGFEEKLFMYCEDVDLSWRLRARGYRLLYCPSITITHYSYSKPGEVKPVAQLFGVKHNFFLRNRYGTAQDIKEGRELLERYAHTEKANLPPSLREKLADTEKESEYFKLTRCESNQFFQPLFDNFDYEIVREGGFFASKIAPQTAKVSVIVRTIGRLNYLEKAIYSIINQTYQNIEIVIVEDGSNKAQELVLNFRDCNIVYHASEKVGRCRAGNIGLELATGSYCNFLDEDDLLYCDHIETLMNAIAERPDYGAVWSSAFCVKTAETADRQSYNERTYIMAHTAEPDKESILVTNYFPIQAVLFRRECYEKLGGFDLEMDFLEDWALWIKFLKQYNFLRVAKTTSLYRVPFQQDISEERKRNLEEYYNRVRFKYR